MGLDCSSLHQTAAHGPLHPFFVPGDQHSICSPGASLREVLAKTGALGPNGALTVHLLRRKRVEQSLMDTGTQ